jgi:hypothetical protein
VKIREKIESWWDGLSEDHREYVRRGIWFVVGFLWGAVLL